MYPFEMYPFEKQYLLCWAVQVSNRQLCDCEPNRCSLRFVQRAGAARVSTFLAVCSPKATALAPARVPCVVTAHGGKFAQRRRSNRGVYGYWCADEERGPIAQVPG